ncbi:MAG: hypothetical protein P1U54_13580 [Immundisolibacteraceae bacterium]|nr:hypothetical protein [Immundisolibacteraceae bacterium]
MIFIPHQPKSPAVAGFFFGLLSEHPDFRHRVSVGATSVATAEVAGISEVATEVAPTRKIAVRPNRRKPGRIEASYIPKNRADNDFSPLNL